MLAVIINWIIISLVFITCGNILTAVYTRISKRNENYNPIDVFILGMCLLCGIIGFNSLFFPTNQITLLILSILSVVYWSIRQSERKKLTSTIRNFYKNTSRTEIILQIISVIAFLLYSTWLVSGHDASIYHSQLIRWNEEYAVIPGLANLEVRFGSNSNYFLLCALTSLRFLSGQAHYNIHTLLALAIMIWIIRNIYKSDFSLKSVFLLFVYIIFIYINSMEDIREMSTDITPNLIIFYLFAKIALDTNVLKQQYLFYLLIPISLFTFKASMALFCLISLYPLVLIIKSKQYSPFVFVAAVAAFILCPWFIRNVFISGYLLYPLHSIDFFAVDWKVPASILQQETDFIHDNSKAIFLKVLYGTNSFGKPARYHIIRSLYICIYTLVILSPLLVGLTALIRKKRQSAIMYFAYAVLAINILFWYTSAADPRFATGALLMTCFFSIYFLLYDYRPKGRIMSMAFLSVCFILIIYPLFDSLKWMRVYSEEPQQYIQSLYRPRFDTTGHRKPSTPNYTEYKLNETVSVYVTDDELGRCYDKIPCVKPQNLSIYNYQNYHLLEARGKSIKDGFRYNESK